MRVRGLAIGFAHRGFAILAAVERHAAEYAQKCAQEGYPEEAVTNAEDDRPRKRAEDDQTVDESVGVPGDDDAAALWPARSRCR